MRAIIYSVVLLCCVYFIACVRCKAKSVTTTSGSHPKKNHPCPGDLIFEENFNKFDLSKWEHEITLAGGGNWEFQYYANNRSNSYVDNGHLHIRPTLLADDFGENFLSSGSLDVNGGSPSDHCTDPSFYGCSRQGTGSNYINPIKSARIRTVKSFNFKFGRVQFRAKNPSGDWLWPAVWLLPRYNAYGKWPASGEIDLLESRGNKNLLNSNGVNVGTQQVSSTLHWGPYNEANQWPQTHYEKNNAGGFDNDFHDFELLWTPNNMTFSIDGEKVGTVSPPPGGFWDLGGFNSSTTDNPWKGGSLMAPFDQEFYIIINLAVGGTSFFDDGFTNPGGKPWSNKSPVAFKDFWKGKDQWMPTWNMQDDSSHLIVDYVKVFAV